MQHKRVILLLVLIQSFCVACAPVAVAPTLPPAVPAQIAAPTLTPRPTVQSTPVSTPTAAPKSGGWWQDAVFYEVFVRSFADGSGDGKGDFKGLTQKLDYLNDGNPNSTSDLGVTALWLMPVNPSPSYHGYDVTDYLGINPDYGSLADFKTFLSEAHKRGIKVIIDWVINHTSDRHPWFKAALNPQSPYRGWYIFSPNDPGNLGPWGQVVWHPASAGGFYYGVFSDQMPDLNLANPAVTAEINKSAAFWLKEVGVDGFRLDAVPYYIENGKTEMDTDATHQWLQSFHQYIHSQAPQAVTVGEVWESAKGPVSYASQGRELDMAFNFDLAEQMLQTVLGEAGQAAGKGMGLNNQEYTAKNAAYGAFLSNHDQNRVMARLGLDENKAKLAAFLYLTGPGTPFIYYGEEIGMDGSKPDESLRTPMQWSPEKNGGFSSAAPWEPPNLNFAQFNVSVESADPQSLLATYRRLVHLRLQHSALRSSVYLPLTADNPAVYAALRISPEETVLLLANLGGTDAGGVHLSLDKGLAPGAYQPGLLLGAGQPAALVANAHGGLDAYPPLDHFPAYSSLVVQLLPQK